MATKGAGDSVKLVGSLGASDGVNNVLGSFDLDFLAGCDNFKRGFRTLPASTAWVQLEPSAFSPKVAWIKSERAFQLSKNTGTTWILKSQGEILLCPDPGSTGMTLRVRNETTPTTTVKCEYFVAGKRQ